MGHCSEAGLCSAMITKPHSDRPGGAGLTRPSGGDIFSFGAILWFDPAGGILPFSNRSARRKHFLSSFAPFPLFDRAAGFPSPRPQDAQAGARRTCQGWPLSAATRRARP